MVISFAGIMYILVCLMFALSVCALNFLNLERIGHIFGLDDIGRYFRMFSFCFISAPLFIGVAVIIFGTSLWQLATAKSKGKTNE